VTTARILAIYRFIVNFYEKDRTDYVVLLYMFYTFLASAVPAGPPGVADEKTPLLEAEEGHESGAVSVPSVNSQGLVKEARGSLEELVKEFKNATKSLSERAFIIL